jgi:tetratricopeptide (TPR) repeat protein
VFSFAEGVPDRFASVSREEWTEALQDATRVGLLTSIGGDMYEIHPALPRYLATEWHTADPGGYVQQRDAGEQALRAVCAVFSNWLGEQIEFGDAALAYTLIGLHRRTLGAMLGLALDHHAWEDADSIIRVLDAYWDIQGLGDEATAWADRLLDATAGLGQSPPLAATSLRLYTTVHQADRQRDAGQPDRAERTYQQALAFLQDQPETEWARANIAVIYHQLGITAREQGRLDEADDWYRRSLAISEEFGNRSMIGLIYHGLGNIAQIRGQLDEADDWYRRSLAIKSLSYVVSLASFL